MRYVSLFAVSLTTAMAVQGGANAQNANRIPLDEPTQVGGVEAVCTGASLDSRNDPRWGAYPMRVEVAGKGGQFLGDVMLRVSKGDQDVLNVTCGGPWILAKLPPAHYVVAATVGSKTVTSAVAVPASGQGRTIVRFPDTGGTIETPGVPATPN
jgi:hypothetical protein